MLKLSLSAMTSPTVTPALKPMTVAMKMQLVILRRAEMRKLLYTFLAIVIVLGGMVWIIVDAVGKVKR
jgi:hypothetical protein